ncbi:MAG: 16S rRNA (adenine(1518)-N(6)/adenine(1519)-N(6))-dimethyltransferase RsmA [Planctomycetota bacterium]
MPQQPARQTLSFLKRRFEEVGILPKVQHGQNFLIDLNLIAVLVEAAELEPRDVVLEVGTGTGSLTAQVAPRCAAVVTVEIDPRMHQLASEELIELSNVTMLQTDALKKKSQLSEELLEAVQKELDAAPNRRFKVVANLPYNVATPVLSNLLALERPPVVMAVTIQKELADRITARPGTKDYSALSVWVQSQCTASILRVLPPEAFWPRPKVSSAFLHIVLEPERRAAIGNLAFFHQFVRAMFFHRRKYLRSELLSAFKNRLDKPAVDGILAEQGIDPTVRAEQLPVETLLQLCDAVRRQTGD